MGVVEEEMGIGLLERMFSTGNFGAFGRPRTFSMTHDDYDDTTISKLQKSPFPIRELDFSLCILVFPHLQARSHSFTTCMDGRMDGPVMCILDHKGCMVGGTAFPF